RYIGYVDQVGKPHFEGPPPAYAWGMGTPLGGGFALQRLSPNNAVSGNVGSRVAPFSPLLTTDKDLSQLYNKSYAEAGVPAGQFGQLEDLLPFAFGE
ncbi:MAG: hypothetical protein HN727_13190, partial [Opitutae bacterium]|nr:hypothetical protein [Opitutae bacterium]